MAGLLARWLCLILGAFWLLLLWSGRKNGRLNFSSSSSRKEEPLVMVIGSCELPGMHLVERLTNKGMAVVAVDHVSFIDTPASVAQRRRMAYMDKALHVTVANADYCLPDILSQLVAKHQPTEIVYFAFNEKVEYSVATQLEEQTRCLSAVLDVTERNVTGPQLLVVTTGGLGISPEADVTTGCVAAMAASLLWAQTKHADRRPAAVFHIDGEVFGPHEHSATLTSAWWEAAANDTSVLTEVNGQGMYFSKDIAAAIHGLLPLAIPWAVYTPGFPPYSYSAVWSEIALSQGVDEATAPPPFERISQGEQDRTLANQIALTSQNPTPLKEAIAEFVAWRRQADKESMARVTFDQLYKAVLKKGDTTKLEVQLDERDRWLDWALLANVTLPPTLGNHTYKFFPNMYSADDPRLLLGKVSKQASLETYIDTCNSQPRCVGFTTDGYLMTGVVTPALWTAFPADKKNLTGMADGLYVVDDIDLCSHIDLHWCPINSRCVTLGPANFTCQCLAGFTQTGPDTCDRLVDDDVASAKQEAFEQESSNQKSPADIVGASRLMGDEGSWGSIVMCTDTAQAVGVAALINSILANSLQPEHLHIYVVTNASEAEDLAARLRCFGLDAIGPDYHGTPHQIHVVGFNTAVVEGLYKVHTSAHITGNLASPLNYARFYLAKLLPNVEQAIYLDVDTIVRSDMMHLANVAREGFQANQNTVLFAVPRASRPMSIQTHEIYMQRHGRDFNENKMVQYNAGVFVINLQRWAQLGLTNEAEFWMRQTLGQKLWDYGTQPIMWLCSLNRTDLLDRRWNVDGLGWAQLAKKTLEAAWVLHWSGKSKPWHPDNVYKSYWLEHRPPNRCGQNEAAQTPPQNDPLQGNPPTQ